MPLNLTKAELANHALYSPKLQDEIRDRVDFDMDAMLRAALDGDWTEAGRIYAEAVNKALDDIIAETDPDETELDRAADNRERADAVRVLG